MALQSINLYFSYEAGFEMLSDAEVGRLILCAIRYARDGAIPELRGNERFIWPMMREQIERDKERYAERCKRQSENALKRWASENEESNGMPSDTTACQTMPNDAKHAKDKDKDKDKDKEKNTNARESSAFDRFWAAYPKKVGKLDAQKAFRQVKAPVEMLIASIEKQKNTSQWTNENGRFIPNPATWLRQGRWMDEEVVEQHGNLFKFAIQKTN